MLSTKDKNTRAQLRFIVHRIAKLQTYVEAGVLLDNLWDMFEKGENEALDEATLSLFAIAKARVMNELRLDDDLEIEDYDEPVPLSKALADVTTKLDALPSEL